RRVAEMEPGLRVQGLRGREPEGARDGRLLRRPLLQGGAPAGDRALLSQRRRSDSGPLSETREDAAARFQRNTPLTSLRARGWVNRFCLGVRRARMVHLFPAATNLTGKRMARHPSEQRASNRVTLGAPASVKWGVEQLSGFVESINL